MLRGGRHGSNTRRGSPACPTAPTRKALCSGPCTAATSPGRPLVPARLTGRRVVWLFAPGWHRSKRVAPPKKPFGGAGTAFDHLAPSRPHPPPGAASVSIRIRRKQVLHVAQRSLPYRHADAESCPGEG